MLTGTWPVSLGLLLLTGAMQAAEAEFTSEACLATKLKAWGKYVSCDSRENAKGLIGKPFDAAVCRTKFDAKLVKLDVRATAAALPCRYQPNPAGTVLDPATGLEWETKSSIVGDEANPFDPHDVNNRYSWCIGSFGHDGCTNAPGVPDGKMFTDFLAKLNNCASSDGVTTSNAGFAGHCDWRIPTLEELRTIFTATPGCGTTSACIDPMFGQTRPGIYWSLTTYAADVDYAWGVDFTGTYPIWADYKFPSEAVRAVRGGLTSASPSPVTP